MIKVLFVCHGNICRSPMAEFILKDMVTRIGKSSDFQIFSSATSTEEIGNPVHYGTRNILASLGISTAGKCAVQLKKTDYPQYDYFIGMDSMNIRNMKRILGCQESDPKIHKLLQFAGTDRDVADPWYTGDFNTTLQDVLAGCRGFLEYLGMDCQRI